MLYRLQPSAPHTRSHAGPDVWYRVDWRLISQPRGTWDSDYAHRVSDFDHFHSLHHIAGSQVIRFRVTGDTPGGVVFDLSPIPNFHDPRGARLQDSERPKRAGRHYAPFLSQRVEFPEFDS